MVSRSYLKIDPVFMDDPPRLVPIGTFGPTFCGVSQNKQVREEARARHA